MLDTQTVEIIKATVPAVKAHADEITACFYPLMFEQYPEVIPFFNQTHQAKGAQPKALANAVVAYAANIDSLGNLSEAVTRIVQKHCSLGITPEQYDIVGSCLLQAIARVLGDAATDEIIAAWGKAYQQLAGILIEAEEAVYQQIAQQEGGWRGLRDFRVTRKVTESTVITSFYLEPSDGGAVPAFKPGQYICIVLEIAGEKVRRNYSLSDAPGTGYLRISVKHEQDGRVSGYLHDQIHEGDRLQLTPPCGDFILPAAATPASEKPLVLVTGGVGITPAISMLNSSAASGRKIHFIHAAQNGQVHAFRDHVDNLAAQHSNVKPYYLYDQPTPACQPHATGLISDTLLAEQLEDNSDVEFYLLGPKPFMQAAIRIARNLDVPADQIHYEFFGPLEEL
ncbi:MAG: NO-inducible flavohemoprotein [Marinobacterium sp.]|nr:NO-inducible flavohemoprotein [Marinobacterium sp.]